MDRLTTFFNHIGAGAIHLASYLQGVQPEQSYFDTISPYLNSYFSIAAWQWLLLVSIIYSLHLVTKKLGSEFLKGMTQLPLLIKLQKYGFCILQCGFILLWFMLMSYILTILIAGVIWFHQLQYVLIVLRASMPSIFSGLLLGFIIGKLLQQLIAKHLEPKYSNKILQKKNAGVEQLSDVRDIAAMISATKDYDPMPYFKPGYIFIGLNEAQSPIYVTLAEFAKVHFQIMGCTGSGKSVAAINMLSQALNQGHSAVMFDPKVGADEWARHVLKAMSNRYQKNFIIIDLQHSTPQINLLEDITQNELNELLQAGMGIEDKGGDADYYRLKDRKAAREASNMAGRAKSFAHLYYLLIQERPSYMEAADSFSDKLEMLAMLPAVQTHSGIQLKQAIDNGDCLYIVGAMRDQQVKMLQKMVLLRLMQLIERRDRMQTHRHVTVFIDELKYFLTRPVLDALSTVRDHQCNLLLGHQGPGDLLDVSKDMSGPACQNTIVTNTNIKLIYKLNDDQDQRKAASLTGEKVVMRQSLRQETNMGVGEIANTDERQLMSMSEPLYSHNYFAQLKPRVGVIVGLGLAKLCFTSPIKIQKIKLKLPVFNREGDYFKQLNNVNSGPELNPKSVDEPSIPDMGSDSTPSKTIDAYDELHAMEQVTHDEQNTFLEEIQ